MTRTAVPLPDHRLTPAEVQARFEAARRESDEALARIVATGDVQRTFVNTPEALEQALASFSDSSQRLQVLKDVHPDAAVRDACSAVDEAAGQYLVEVGARRDLHRAVKAWAEGPGAAEYLDSEGKRLVELQRREFRRNGLELDDASLARLVTIRSRLTVLSTEFQRHLNENADAVSVTDEELEGVPASLVERLAKAEAGGRLVTTKSPDYLPFMENAKHGAARRRLYIAYNRRESERNLPLLTEAVRLRDEAAKLLGYATHADFVTEDRMAKSGRTVREFLEPLAKRIRPRLEADLAKLATLKGTETGDARAMLEPWDIAYYLNLLRKREFALDTEAIRAYFPLDRVLKGMFGVYEDLFGLELVEVTGADTWAPEVKLFDVRDRGTGESLARFYTDLFPRSGKYGHAAVAPFTVPRDSPEGYRQPVALLMANFNPPAAGKPSLLSHEEVRTLFHEFGHVMHQGLTTARYASQAGFNVAGDFVEAPSQMLENWVFEPAVLRRMSGHVDDPTRLLPDEIIEKLRAARLYDAGWRYSRQLFFALFDQALHTSGAEVDPTALEHRLHAEILRLAPAPESHFAASFGHLMGGYDAGYYGYLWSEVFAADMFTLFEKDGVLDPTLGRRYRDTILAKGRSVEPDALLAAFLGRPATSDAFVKRLGV